MKVVTKFGTCEVGEFVVFHKGKTSQVGKIVGVSANNCVDLYVGDETGGYHITVPIPDLTGPAKVGSLTASKEEDISKPKRYNKVGKLECWDVIIDQEMDFLEGSVLKYVWRHKEKNGPQDLKKAVEYLNKMIGDYEKLYGKK